MHSCNSLIDLQEGSKEIIKPNSWRQFPPILDPKDYFELGGRLNLPSPVFQTMGGRQKYVAADLRRKEKFSEQD